MWSKYACIFSALISVGACTKVPELSKRVTTVEVLERLNCELHDAYLRNKAFLDKYYSNPTIGVILTLQVDASSTIGPNVVFIRPAFEGLFNIGGGLSLSNSASRAETLNLNLPLNMIKCIAPPPYGRNLKGDLRIAEWLQTQLHATYYAGVSSGQVQSFGHTVKFIVTGNANVTPTLALVDFKSGGPGPLLDLKRVTTNTLALTFAAGPNEKATQAAIQQSQTNQLLQLIVPNTVLDR